MVDRVLDCCCTTTSSLDPCLAWLSKAGRPITSEWAMAIINGYLQEDKVPFVLKETLIIPLRKKLSLAADNIGNYRPIANVSFVSKVVERVVANQLQALLDETNALDPFQSSFKPCRGTETILVTLFDYVLREALHLLFSKTSGCCFVP